jgi:hypothetical protein
MNLKYRHGLPAIVLVFTTITSCLVANASPGDGKSNDGRGTSMSTQDTPWVRCMTGQRPNYSETPHMDGGRAKNYPEHDMGWNKLFPGDVLLIDAVDWNTVQIDIGIPADPSQDTFTPNGISPAQSAPSGWPGVGLNKYGLIAWFTSGGWPPSFYGSDGWCVTVPSNVSNAFWTLSINDSQTWDNNGYWDVVINHYW